MSYFNLRRLMALFFSTYSMNREKGSPSMQLRCRILVLEEVLSSLSSTEEPREARLPRIKLSYAKSFCFLHCTLHLHLILCLWLFPAHKIYIDKYRYRLVYLNNSPFRDVRALCMLTSTFQTHFYRKVWIQLGYLGYLAAGKRWHRVKPLL